VTAERRVGLRPRGLTPSSSLSLTGAYTDNFPLPVLLYAIVVEEVFDLGVPLLAQVRACIEPLFVIKLQANRMVRVQGAVDTSQARHIHPTDHVEKHGSLGRANLKGSHVSKPLTALRCCLASWTLRPFPRDSGAECNGNGPTGITPAKALIENTITISSSRLVDNPRSLLETPNTLMRACVIIPHRLILFE
jgi:hypothetical protein